MRIHEETLPGVVCGGPALEADWREPTLRHARSPSLTGKADAAKTCREITNDLNFRAIPFTPSGGCGS